MEFRDLHAQYDSLQPQINEAIQRVLDSGRYIGGPEVATLEKKLADYVGVKHCITCGNGTDALQLALMAWDIGPGDAVIIPDFTFFSSGEVVAAVGATPVFVDVDPITFNLDPNKLYKTIKLIENDTALIPKVVMAVDLFGLPANFPAIRAICTEYGLKLLEDGAQGFGGSIESEMACSFGDIATTSFFPAKPLGCYGDGGAVFTDDDEWASLIRSFAVHGKGTTKYDNVRIGMNSRLDSIQAAILNVKLDAFIGAELDAADRVAKLYTAALQPCITETGTLPPSIPESYRSSWAQYTITLPSHVDRDVFQSKLKEADIPTAIYYPKPMHTLIAFKDACYCFDECPVTQSLTENALSLPMSPYLNDDDLNRVCAKIRETLMAAR